MGTKKIPTVDLAVKGFVDVMLRASLERYIHVNHYLFSKCNGYTVILQLDPALWDAMMKDTDFTSKVTEWNPNDPTQSELSTLLQYADKMDEDGWIEPDLELLFGGKPIQITINGFEYQITITKDSLPVKLKKAEQTDIHYRVFSKPQWTLGLKKRFTMKDLDAYGFTMMRLFQII